MIDASPRPRSSPSVAESTGAMTIGGSSGTEYLASFDDLIPHRFPMCLVQAINDASETSMTTVSAVESWWPTAQVGRVSTVLLIELIAQTAALHEGWRQRATKTQGGRGFLVGVKRSCFHVAAVPVGAKLHATIQVTHTMSNYRVFEGQVTYEGQMIAEATLQTFRPESESTDV